MSVGRMLSLVTSVLLLSSTVVALRGGGPEDSLRQAALADSRVRDAASRLSVATDTGGAGIVLGHVEETERSFSQSE
ncbi:MAG TPA: hypothetical protein VFY29_12630 [Terriglobia bacterium]|nr:hypothetical protein [Terriglobia bacterium]